jgi:hypothetical protein
MRIVDDAKVSVEPVTAAERRDLEDEREAEEYAEVYELVRAERQAAGKADSPIIICAEAAKRLRAGAK